MRSIAKVQLSFSFKKIVFEVSRIAFLFSVRGVVINSMVLPQSSEDCSIIYASVDVGDPNLSVCEIILELANDGGLVEGVSQLASAPKGVVLELAFVFRPIPKFVVALPIQLLGFRMYFSNITISIFIEQLRPTH